MLIFGNKKKNSKPSIRCDEPTVQILQENRRLPWVDTAMASHIGTRAYQQDSVYVSEPTFEAGDAFGILCDGMGGMQSGELVSADVVEFLANKIVSIPGDADIPSFFETAVREANELVRERYVRKGQDGGTTLVSVFIRDKTLYWAAVGDSRIYIWRDGEMVRVTRDHNYALQLQGLVEEGKISQLEADQDPQRESLISYLGAPVLEMADVSRGPFLLRTGDLVLLCSDGLTKSLEDMQILELLGRGLESLEEMAYRLTTAAMDQSPAEQDNTTVILMRYFGSCETGRNTD